MSGYDTSYEAIFQIKKKNEKKKEHLNLRYNIMNTYLKNNCFKLKWWKIIEGMYKANIGFQFNGIHQ